MATLAELLSSPWTQQQAQGVADYKRQRRAYDRQEDYNFNQQNRLMEEARLAAIADRKKEEEELKQKAEEAKRNEQVYSAFDRYFYGLNPESRAGYNVGATRAMSPQEAAALMSRIQGQEAMLEQRWYSEQQKRDEARTYAEERKLAERQQRLLAEMTKSQTLEAQRRAKMENERMEIYQYPGGVMVGNTPEGRSAIAKRRAMDDWNKSQPKYTQDRSIGASKLDYMRGSYGSGGRF